MPCKTDASDMYVSPLIPAGIGVAVGCIAATVFFRRKVTINQHQLTIANEQIQKLSSKIALLEAAEQSWKNSASKLSDDLVKANALYSKSLSDMKELTMQSVQLVNRLQSSNVRGTWGERSLKRAVEQMGLNPYCDFITQSTISAPDGDVLRPDMIVRLSNDRCVVVDSKAPLTSFQRAIEADDPRIREDFFKEHAKAVSDHMKRLSKRNYDKYVAGHPVNFVVMYLPYEALYSAALEYDDSLLDTSNECNVLCASPTTFMGLLLMVDKMWKTDQTHRDSLEIARAGEKVYADFEDTLRHMGTVGVSLEKTVKNYNSVLQTLQKKLFVSARSLSRYYQKSGGADAATGTSLAKGGKTAKEPQPISLAVNQPRLHVSDEKDEQ